MIRMVSTLYDTTTTPRHNDTNAQEKNKTRQNAPLLKKTISMCAIIVIASETTQEPTTTASTATPRRRPAVPTPTTTLLRLDRASWSWWCINDFRPERLVQEIVQRLQVSWRLMLIMAAAGRTDHDA